MAIFGDLLNSQNCCAPSSTQCPDSTGCPPGVCPDFETKRHDTEPPFILSVTDCDGPLDLSDTIVEVSMWAKAKLKTAITTSSTSLAFADAVGFEQALAGDVIVMDKKRSPEIMLITGFDEANKLVSVTRGYRDSTIGAYAKGSALRIFRIMSGQGEANVVTQDVEQVDGTTQTDVVTDAQLLYHWRPQDTCLPGCYWFEWKLLKIQRDLITPAAIVDDFVVEVLGKANATDITPPQSVAADCLLGGEVEWVRRFPTQAEGYLIRISDSPTSESIV